MIVNLTAITQPVNKGLLIENDNRAINPISVVYRAFRVCYSKGGYDKIILPTKEDGTLDTKAMQDFVMKYWDKHHSPLEHIAFTFEISGVSRALTHQLVRHRTGKFSQQSQRYVNMDTATYVTPPSIKMVEEANKIYNDTINTIEKAYLDISKLLLTKQCVALFNKYSTRKDLKLLEHNFVEKPFSDEEILDLIAENYSDKFKAYMKLAYEDARYLMPNACTSNITVTMDWRNLRSFLNLRQCTHAQWEIRLLARSMAKQCKNILPIIDREVMDCGKTCFDCIGIATCEKS